MATGCFAVLAMTVHFLIRQSEEGGKRGRLAALFFPLLPTYPINYHFIASTAKQSAAFHFVIREHLTSSP